MNKHLQKLTLILAIFFTTNGFISAQCVANFIFNPGLNGIVTFTSTSTGTNISTSYSWNFGEPISGFNIGNGTNPNHIYGSNGVYSVTLTISNGTLGCTSSIVQNVTVTSSPCNLPINASWTYTVAGPSASFVSTSTGTTGGANYTWSFGNGNIANTPSTNNTYTMSGFYNVKLKVVDAGCVDSLTIPSINVCFLQPSFSSSLGLNGLYSFTSTSTGVAGLGNPNWAFGDGGTATGYLASHQYTSNGNYSVWLSYNTTCPNYTANAVATVTNANGIGGYLYKDNNGNCVKDIGDLNLVNIPLKLYNNTGSLVAQYVSSQSSAYFFNLPTGTYNVIADTASLPVAPQCPTPGIDSTNIVLTGGSPWAQNVNFNFDCGVGFDVGCNGRQLLGNVFPGTTHEMRVFVQPNNFGNLNCAAGVSGQVILSINGPVTFSYVTPGALTPIIAGNGYTYNVTDFSILTPTSFALALKTNTNAIIGNSICVGVTVIPIPGDVNLSNNTYTFCHPVGNSYDPNKKEVYPGDVNVGFQDWFTYTIHFQNLGNAAANNIRILDTLDNNLDLESFRVINYSHPYSVSLDGKIANFFFPNIMLPDSISDPNGSNGFIQYKVKPKPGLPSGTQIKNTGHIYFDFNPAVVTNQTINNFILGTGINKNSLVEDASISIYPTPTSGKLNIKVRDINLNTKNVLIEVYDVLGNKVYDRNFEPVNGSIDAILNLDQLTNGLYSVKIKTKDRNYLLKTIVNK